MSMTRITVAIHERMTNEYSRTLIESIVDNLLPFRILTAFILLRSNELKTKKKINKIVCHFCCAFVPYPIAGFDHTSIIRSERPTKMTCKTRTVRPHSSADEQIAIENNKINKQSINWIDFASIKCVEGNKHNLFALNFHLSCESSVFNLMLELGLNVSDHLSFLKLFLGRLFQHMTSDERF